MCAASPASAGQLTLVINTEGSGCNLLTPFGGAGDLYTTPCGTGPLQVAYHAAYRSLVGSTIGGPDMRHFMIALPVASGTRAGFQVNAPAGFTINGATISSGSTSGINAHRGWGGATYWDSGHNALSSNAQDFHGDVKFQGDAINRDGPYASRYWGVVMVCGWAQCSNPGQISLNSVILTATENQAPSLTAIGSNNLWYQTAHWIWNAPGDAWPLTLDASDSSGVCGLGANVSAHVLADPLPPPDFSQWQQCPDPTWTPAQGAAVDTHDYVATDGQMPLSLEATNAAQVTSSVSETLNVDNDPVSVSLSTPDDPNPSVWVNHAVTVDAKAQTGPSGLGGETCSQDGQAAQAYPANGITVNGDGAKTISCTAWNQAVDPEGNHASGTSSITLHIDQTPPSLSLAQAPDDPTGLLVDTSDSESGVAGGSIEMTRAGSDSWTSLPTTLNGGRLQAHFDDAGLHGRYAFRATSCDNVGNCASTDRALTLPVREPAISDVSVAGAISPQCASAAREIRTATRAQRRLAVDMRRGPFSGRYSRRTLAAVRDGVRSGSCATPAAFRNRARVRFGQTVAVRGALTTGAGVPLPGQPVDVLSAPDDGSGAFTQAAAVTTAADGSWSATLPAGPSRIIRAAYPGSAAVLPATGEARVMTPAKIKITSVSPDRTRWGGTVLITGQVLGGYIPSSSKLLRLDLGIVGIPGLSKIQGIPNISSDGHFTRKYTFTHLYGVVRFWLMVSTLSEADFPFAKAHSRRVIVTVGVPTSRRRRGARVSSHSNHLVDRHRHRHRQAERAAAHHRRHHHRHHHRAHHRARRQR